ncbi:MAG: hypothetical protein ACRBI6_09245 [Acidimicrobiales bacterium]
MPDPTANSQPAHLAQKRRGDHRPPSFPEPTLRVDPWPDPVLDKLGHDPRSLYVETFYPSMLGPSSILLLRRLASALELHPDGFDLDTVALAAELGLGQKGGRNSPFWKTLDRTCRFGLTHRSGDQLRVRRRLAPLTLRQIDRLPDHLQPTHARWIDPEATPEAQAA